MIVIILVRATTLCTSPLKLGENNEERSDEQAMAPPDSACSRKVARDLQPFLQSRCCFKLWINSRRPSCPQAPPPASSSPSIFINAIKVNARTTCGFISLLSRRDSLNRGRRQLCVISRNVVIDHVPEGYYRAFIHSTYSNYICICLNYCVIATRVPELTAGIS